MTGASNLKIVEHAAREHRVIITQDLDSGRIFVERDPPALIALTDAFLKHVDLDAAENAERLFVLGPRGHRYRKRTQ